MEYLIEGSTMTGIADAIRSKTGESSVMTPLQMISAIEGMSIGGGSVVAPLKYYGDSTISEYTGNEIAVYDYAFYSCFRLTTVSFPQCNYIGNYTFGSCRSLTTVSFPECSYIGDNAFYSCINLATVFLSECSYIGNFAFRNCSQLTTVSFPKCSYIGSSAFESCHSLTTVSFPQCSYIGSSAFGSCHSLITVSFPQCNYIGGSAFMYCVHLTTASFPECSYIGFSAFNNCTSLSTLYLLSTAIVSLVDQYTFNASPLSNLGSGTIYVPSSLYNGYITAKNWSKLSARIASYVES